MRCLRLCLAFLLIGLPALLRAQVDCWVVDGLSGEGVAVATVASVHGGRIALSDATGHFRSMAADSLVIRHVAYQEGRFGTADLVAGCTLRLQPAIYDIDTVAVTDALSERLLELPHFQTASIGTPKQPDDRAMRQGAKRCPSLSGIAFLEGDMVGEHLLEVSLYCGQKLKRGHHLRLRIMALDTTGMPTRDLLVKSLYFPQRKRWATIDLSAYGIKVPANGLFVGLEDVGRKRIDFEASMLHADERERWMSLSFGLPPALPHRVMDYSYCDDAWRVRQPGTPGQELSIYYPPAFRLRFARH